MRQRLSGVDIPEESGIILLIIITIIIITIIRIPLYRPNSRAGLTETLKKAVGSGYGRY